MQLASIGVLCLLFCAACTATRASHQDPASAVVATAPLGVSATALPPLSPTTVLLTPIKPQGVFAAELTPQDQELLRQALAMTQAYWGAGASPLAIFAGSQIDAIVDAYLTTCKCSLSRGQLDSIKRQVVIPGDFEAPGPGALFVVAADTYRMYGRRDLIDRLLHDLFHTIQAGLSAGPWDPTWMAEGSAEYSMLHVQIRNGIQSDELAHSNATTEANKWSYQLSDLEYTNDGGPNSSVGRAPYNLGHLATDLLVTQYGGQEAILNYWRFLGNNRLLGMSREAAWKDAFRRAFGLPVEDFYERFERFRARGFR